MSFEIDIEWPSSEAGRGGDVADVRLLAHTHLLTQNFEPATRRYRDSFRASVVSLAFWFADNWWRLRWESLGAPSLATIDWRLRHEMSSGAGNELWPPVMIYGSGPRVMLAPSLGRRRQDSEPVYLDQKPVSLLGAEYEEGVDHFFERVLQQCASHADAEALRALIAQLTTEREDDELAGWRRLEACLGFDPDKAPDEVVEALIDREDEFGGEAIEEAAAAAPGETSAVVLATALDAARSANLVVDLSAVAATPGIPDPHGQLPWRAAEEAADALRGTLGLPSVIDGDVLAQLLNTRWADLKSATATARNLPYAVRAPGEAGRSHLALKMIPQIDRRFELARVIGDAMWTRGQGLGVVSRTRTDRQKYQRAFAQSLLCPMGSLRRTIDFDNPTEEQIREAAARQGVRESVITTILVNRGILPRENWADLVEAA